MDLTIRRLIDQPPLMTEMHHERRQRAGAEKRKEKDVEPPKTFEHEELTNRGDRQVTAPSRAPSAAGVSQRRLLRSRER